MGGLWTIDGFRGLGVDSGQEGVGEENRGCPGCQVARVLSEGTGDTGGRALSCAVIHVAL